MKLYCASSKTETYYEVFNNQVHTHLGRWYEKRKWSTLELAHLRDTLLPKLLSGELRIPDTEKRVAEAF